MTSFPPFFLLFVNVTIVHFCICGVFFCCIWLYRPFFLLLFFFLLQRYHGRRVVGFFVYACSWSMLWWISLTIHIFPIVLMYCR
jgi:hypothetical protein